MTIQRFLIVLMKWLAAFALASGIVMLIRLFCIESYRISTDSMEEALHKGDYILVNKIPGKNKPVRGKVVLFTSPLSRDSADAPLFISRCIGMPGDTIRVSMDGYTINGQKIPRSPRSLSSYFITLSAKETFLETLEKLDIPLRDFRQPHGFRGISIEGGIARCHKPSFYRGTNARIHVDRPPERPGLPAGRSLAHRLQGDHPAGDGWQGFLPRRKVISGRAGD